MPIEERNEYVEDLPDEKHDIEIDIDIEIEMDYIDIDAGTRA